MKTLPRNTITKFLKISDKEKTLKAIRLGENKQTNKKNQEHVVCTKEQR